MSGLEVACTIANIVSSIKGFLKLNGEEKSKMTDIKAKKEIINKDNIIIKTGGGDVYIGNFHQLSDDDIDKIMDKFIKTPKEKETRIIDYQFYDEAVQYEETFNTGDELVNHILPFLEPKMTSIFNLAKRVDYYYEIDEHKKALEIKDNIATMYGKEGNKLCNLYTSGYVDQAVEYYLDVSRNDKKIAEDINVKRKFINELMQSLLIFAKHIHYVNKGDDVTTLSRKIKQDMDDDAKYIAIHSAGTKNISVATQTTDKIRDEIEKEDYEISFKEPETKSSTPLLEIVITKRD